MKSFLRYFFRHSDLLPLLLFFIIFCTYFTSSAGLINSGDAPQFFTTEALIRNGNVDLLPFRNDAHFFIWPDYFIRNGQLFSFRGFVQSFLMIPLHVIAPLIVPLMTDGNFPLSIQTPGFLYELAVVSLFTLFSAVGIMLFWNILYKLSGSKIVSFLLCLSFAFGTYAWKYSAYYARQGVVLLLSGIVIYSVFKIYFEDKSRWWFAILGVCFSLAFGLDTIFSLSVATVIALLVVFFLRKKGRNGLTSLGGPSVPGMVLFLLILYLANRWYGNPSPNQYLQSFQFLGIPPGERLRVMVSAPFFPVLYTLLFSFGPPPASAFTQFADLPQITKIYSSVLFARYYNFFGLFSVSPFYFFSFIIPVWKLPKKTLGFLSICFILFVTNIIGNAKFYTFWGGNQYDIRYVYTAGIFLLPLIAVSIGFFLRIRDKIIVRPVYVGLFILAVAWSLFMGWLGEINMFGPAASSERKIWLDALDFPFYYAKHSFNAYIHATFMNRENLLVALIIAVLAYLLFFLIRMLYNAARYEYTVKTERRKKQKRYGKHKNASTEKKSGRLHRPL